MNGFQAGGVGNYAGGNMEFGQFSGVANYADGEALIGANVFLEEVKLGSAANVSGYYVIPDVDGGDFTLVATYIGYKMHRQTVRLEPGQHLKVNINLNAEVLAAEGMVVRADSLTTGERLFRQPVPSVALSSRQINNLPQVAEADLLRSLQSLPGILPLSDFSSALYIRGGTPDQNLYMIDGSDVYNPEHAFGIFSTFNTDAIKYVELYKGGFDAESGGRLSSILDVTHLDGNRAEFEGSASLSLLSAKTTFYVYTVRSLNLDSDEFIYDNPFEELDRQDVEDDLDDYDYSWNWIQNTPSTTGRSAIEIFWFDLWFYGDYEVVVYTADKNFIDFLRTFADVQEEDCNFHEPKFNIEGDGIGVFGAAIADRVQIRVERE